MTNSGTLTPSDAATRTDQCLQIMGSNGCGPLRPIHQEMWRVCGAVCHGVVPVCPPCVGVVAEALSQFNQHIWLTGPHRRINQNKVTLPTICTQTERDWEVFTSVTVHRKSICTLMSGQTEGLILQAPSLTQIFEWICINQVFSSKEKKRRMMFGCSLLHPNFYIVKKHCTKKNFRTEFPGSGLVSGISFIEANYCGALWCSIFSPCTITLEQGNADIFWIIFVQ